MTKSSGALTNTPTLIINGGNSLTIRAAAEMERQRGLVSQKTNPSASAPAVAAAIPSSRFVIPQILTLTDMSDYEHSMGCVRRQLPSVRFGSPCPTPAGAGASCVQDAMGSEKSG